MVILCTLKWLVVQPRPQHNTAAAASFAHPKINGRTKEKKQKGLSDKKKTDGVRKSAIRERSEKRKKPSFTLD